ncbi:MAG: hypothetical protein CSB47_10455 [Proteobacteria bacterium]|nr:MAG: hypothetical protein CSB47_10455 [Pseudomonadota bacterium]
MNDSANPSSDAVRKYRAWPVVPKMKQDHWLVVLAIYCGAKNSSEISDLTPSLNIKSIATILNFLSKKGVIALRIIGGRKLAVCELTEFGRYCAAKYEQALDKNELIVLKCHNLDGDKKINSQEKPSVSSLVSKNSDWISFLTRPLVGVEGGVST